METDEQKPTGLIWPLIILVLIGFAAAAMFFERDNQNLIALQSPASRPTPSRQARIYTIYYGLGVFSPTNIRIHVGDSVKFQNDGSLPVRIVSDSTDGLPDLAGFDSVGEIPAKSAFTYTFSKAGTFGYHNAKNPSEEGTVIVRPQ